MRQSEARLTFSVSKADALWQQALRRQPAIIDDIYDDSVFAATFREAVGENLPVWFAHVKSALLVPLALQDDVIGLVAVSHGTAGYFTEHNAALVMAVANHAAVAIDNARLFQRVQQRTRELSTLLELSHSVTATLSLNQLVPVILESLQSVISYMGASILLREGNELAIVTYDPSIDTTAPRQSPLRFQLNESMPLWQNMLRHEPAIIGDVHDDSPLARSFRQTVGENVVDATFDLVNAVLVVPLASQGVVSGVIALSHVEKDFFTQNDASLAMTVANQAAVALQNARLFESIEERTRELSTLLDVSHDVTSTLELDPLLNLILDQVRIVADYDRASVMLLEDGGLMVAAVKATVAESERTPFPKGTLIPMDVSSGAMGRLARGKPIIIDDARGESAGALAYRASVGTPAEDVDFRSWMAVPLVQQDRLIGLLSLGKNTPGFYTERHGQLASAIANQAAVAVDNARLFESTEARTRELKTLLDVSQSVASTLDLRTLVRVILEQARSVLDYERSSVTLVDRDNLTVFSVLNADGNEVGTLALAGTTFSQAAAGLLWETLKSGQYVILDDVFDDSEMAGAYRRLIPVQRGTTDFRSWMAVPLSSQNAVLGLLAFTHRDVGHYSERDARLAMAIANQAAVAVENARLFASVEQRTRELSALLDVSHSVAATLDLRALVGLILEQLKLVSDYSGSSLLTLDGDDLVIMDSRGPFERE
ncbi:MAG TPA: GAF domain-containing protein, partial [Dehalococcoidia bacterium]|nr:GAF domain-containing protein [Dehalococcoidia bacterium]